MINRILIVDDQKNWRYKIKQLLKDMGLEVNSASNYGIALRKLREIHYDLIIVDIFLDEYGFSGQGGRVFELMRNKYPNIGVIAITGEPEPIPLEKIRDLFIEYQIVDFIHKSAFEIKKFKQIVLRHINIKSHDSLMELKECIDEISNEIFNLQHIIRKLSIHDQYNFHKAIQILSKKDNSEDILKRKIEVCIPLIPLFINWKAELDLNTIGEKTSDIINSISIATCEKIIKCSSKLKKFFISKKNLR